VYYQRDGGVAVSRKRPGLRVICDNETLRARYVVLAEGANSELAERHGLLPRPSPTAMALGIKAVLAMERKTLEDRFRLEGNEGAAMLFTGGVCGDLPGGAFLYTNQETISFGIICPLSTLGKGAVPASKLLDRLKSHPACALCCRVVKRWNMARIWYLKAACTACRRSMPEKAGCWWATRCAPASIPASPCAGWTWP
jgi:electron transfer flavoprotein-quinone oxidoreductase